MLELDKPANIDQYQGHGEVIRVVDDVPEQRAIASQMVTVMGYTAAAAAGGEEALAYLEDNPCDPVLRDMIMAPGLNGHETYRRMVDKWPGQKAIIATGYSETNRVKEAQSIGAGAYLQKPYTFEK